MKYILILLIVGVCGCGVNKAQWVDCEIKCKANGGAETVFGYGELRCRCANGASFTEN